MRTAAGPGREARKNGAVPIGVPPLGLGKHARRSGATWRG